MRSMSPRALRPVDSIEERVSRATSGLLLEHALGAARLDDDEVERVADDVVELAGDARALAGDSFARASLAVALEEAGVLLDDGRVFAAVSHKKPMPQATLYVANVVTASTAPALPRSAPK